jgi:hypothetical protein
MATEPSDSMEHELAQQHGQSVRAGDGGAYKQVLQEIRIRFYMCSNL